MDGGRANPPAPFFKGEYFGWDSIRLDWRGPVSASRNQRRFTSPPSP
ncbi:hypothetical protein [Lysobacter gummosus]